MFSPVASYCSVKYEWNVSERFGKTFQSLYCSVYWLIWFYLFPVCNIWSHKHTHLMLKFETIPFSLNPCWSIIQEDGFYLSTNRWWTTWSGWSYYSTLASARAPCHLENLTILLISWVIKSMVLIEFPGCWHYYQQFWLQILSLCL